MNNLYSKSFDRGQCESKSQLLFCRTWYIGLYINTVSSPEHGCVFVPREVTGGVLPPYRAVFLVCSADVLGSALRRTACAEEREGSRRDRTQIKFRDPCVRLQGKISGDGRAINTARQHGTGRGARERRDERGGRRRAGQGSGGETD